MADVTKDDDEGSKGRLAAYEQLCISYREIDDFRAKLLGWLPLASAGGAFLLLNDAFTKAEQGKLPHATEFLKPLGLFGFVITLGLFFYEIYGIRKCHALIEAGKLIEAELKITNGQFIRRPRNVLYVINEPFAAGIIYPAVMAAWVFLASLFSGPRAAIDDASARGIRVFLIGFVVTLAYNILLPHEKAIHDFLARKKTEIR